MPAAIESLGDLWLRFKAATAENELDAMPSGAELVGITRMFAADLALRLGALTQHSNVQLRTGAAWASESGRAALLHQLIDRLPGEPPTTYSLAKKLPPGIEHQHVQNWLGGAKEAVWPEDSNLMNLAVLFGDELGLCKKELLASLRLHYGLHELARRIADKIGWQDVEWIANAALGTASRLSKKGDESVAIDQDTAVKLIERGLRSPNACRWILSKVGSLDDSGGHRFGALGTEVSDPGWQTELLVVCSEAAHQLDSRTHGPFERGPRTERGMFTIRRSLALQKSGVPATIEATPLAFSRFLMVSPRLWEEAKRKRAESVAADDAWFRWEYEAMLAEDCEVFRQPQEAYAHFCRAQEANSSEPILWYRGARVLIEMGLLPEAKAQLQKAVQLAPDWIPALVESARVTLLQGDPDSALAELREHPGALMTHRGCVLMREICLTLKRWGDGYLAATRVHRWLPHDPQNLHVRACALARVAESNSGHPRSRRRRRARTFAKEAEFWGSIETVEEVNLIVQG